MAGSLKVLDGKTALILGGGGGGIGRAITQGLAAAGAAAAVADLDGERADEAAAEAVSAGTKAVGLTDDVRSREDVDGLVAGAVQELGGLDILVTVVGGQLAFVPAVPLHETTDEDWDLMFDLNLRYVARAVRAAVPVFLAQGRGGTIVSVGSITGSVGSPLQAAYGAAKAGLTSLARSVAAEYSLDGIRMNVVTCGPDRNGCGSSGAGGYRHGLDPHGPSGGITRGRRRGGVSRLSAVVLYLRSEPGARRRCDGCGSVPGSRKRRQRGRVNAFTRPQCPPMKRDRA